MLKVSIRSGRLVIKLSSRLGLVEASLTQRMFAILSGCAITTGLKTDGLDYGLLKSTTG